MTHKKDKFGRPITHKEKEVGRPVFEVPKGFEIPKGKAPKDELVKKPAGGGGGRPEPEITEPRVFRERTEDGSLGKIIGVELPGGRTFLGRTPQEVESIIEGFNRPRALPPGAVEFGETEEQRLQREQTPEGIEERREEVGERLGTTPLIERLTEDIVNRPSLEPTPLLSTKQREKISKQQREFIGRILTGKASKKELIEEAKNFATGLVITGAVIGAVFGAPYIASSAAGQMIKSAASTKILSMKGVILTLSATAAGGGIINYDGLEMSTMRNTLTAYTEDGEKLQILAQEGLPLEIMLNILEQYIDEVDDAEIMLKEAGEFNLLNRFGSRWKDDMSNIRTARLAIFKRVQAIENLALTGRPTLNPEAVMWNAARFAEGK